MQTDSDGGPFATRKMETSANRDAEQRQKLIDRLLEELENRTEAVRRVGQDLVRERDLAAEQAREIADLRARLEQSEAKTSKLLRTADIDMLTLPELRKRYVALVDRLDAALAVNKKLTDDVKEARADAVEKTRIEASFTEIQMAHTAQQAYVLELQEAAQKSIQLTKVVKQQEKVIEKLEELLKASTQSSEDVRRDSGVASTAVDSVSPDLDSNVDKKETQKEPDIPITSSFEQISRRTSDAADLVLFMRAERAEARCRSLEEELMRSAKTFGAQIGYLKAQNSELRNKLAALQGFRR